jgi:hypothetical protein
VSNKEAEISQEVRQEKEKPVASPSGPQFMLQEHSRIIDAYHDLHVQKNELIKFYLAFVSFPASIVLISMALFKYLENKAQAVSALQSLEMAAMALASLLLIVGVSVIMVMLNIRSEQYLYVQTINGTREYFKEKHGIEEKYLVLPSDTKKIEFGSADRSGRPFWEAMIVSATNSLLLAFIAGRLSHLLNAPYPYLIPIIMFILSLVVHAELVRFGLKKKFQHLKQLEERRRAKLN